MNYYDRIILGYLACIVQSILEIYLPTGCLEIYNWKPQKVYFFQGGLYGALSYFQNPRSWYLAAIIVLKPSGKGSRKKD